MHNVGLVNPFVDLQAVKEGLQKAEKFLSYEDKYIPGKHDYSKPLFNYKLRGEWIKSEKVLY